MKLELFYHDNELTMVGLLIDGIKHFTADVRCSNELYFVTSKITVSDEFNNDKRMQELIDIEYYVRKDVDVEVESQIGYLTCHYIAPELKYMNCSNCKDSGKVTDAFGDTHVCPCQK